MDKTSLVINRDKVAEAREILGTKTLADTVDAALDEVIRLEKRRRVMDRIRKDGGLGPGPDELIAAVEEVHEVTLLHYDSHFDAIARVTGQPAEWLARRGSLD